MATIYSKRVGPPVTIAFGSQVWYWTGVIGEKWTRHKTKDEMVAVAEYEYLGTKRWFDREGRPHIAETELSR